MPAWQGALPTLFAATMDVPGNTYIGPHRVSEMRGWPAHVGRSRAAGDPDLAQGAVGEVGGAERRPPSRFVADLVDGDLGDVDRRVRGAPAAPGWSRRCLSGDPRDDVDAGLVDGPEDGVGRRQRGLLVDDEELRAARVGGPVFAIARVPAG